MVITLKVQGTIKSLIILALCAIKKTTLIYVIKDGCIIETKTI